MHKFQGIVEIGQDIELCDAHAYGQKRSTQCKLHVSRSLASSLCVHLYSIHAIFLSWLGG